MLSTSHSSKILSRQIQGWRRAFAIFSACFLMGGVTKPVSSAEPNRTSAYALSAGDNALLDELQWRAFRFFDEQTDPQTGLTHDRAPADGGISTKPASIAATGFALTAWCIADQRGWLPPGEARRRVEKTLAFFVSSMPNEHGWIYHFVDAHTGARAWKCEASTIDTALFLQGAIGAREYFGDSEIRSLVDTLYSRIEWKWALNGGQTLTHGWWPETGFIPYRWDSYAEMLGLYLLGIGAPKNPLPAEA